MTEETNKVEPNKKQLKPNFWTEGDPNLRTNFLAETKNKVEGDSRLRADVKKSKKLDDK